MARRKTGWLVRKYFWLVLVILVIIAVAFLVPKSFVKEAPEEAANEEEPAIVEEAIVEEVTEEIATRGDEPICGDGICNLGEKVCVKDCEECSTDSDCESLYQSDYECVNKFCSQIPSSAESSSGGSSSRSESTSWGDETGVETTGTSECDEDNDCAPYACDEWTGGCYDSCDHEGNWSECSSSYGCALNGVCVGGYTITQQCTDTDTGYDLGVQGTTIGTSYYDGVDTEWTDFCTQEGQLVEYWCSGEGAFQGYAYGDAVDCAEGQVCESGVCVTVCEIKYECNGSTYVYGYSLADFPKPFIRRSGYNINLTAFVVGDDAKAIDVLATIDMSSKFQYEYSKYISKEIPVQSLLASEVIENPASYNMILVGTVNGPNCDPSLDSSFRDLMSDLFNITCDGWSFDGGEALVKLVENGRWEDTVALLIAGTTGDDTRRATRALKNFDDHTFAGTKVVVSGTTLTDATVEVIDETCTMECVEKELVLTLAPEVRGFFVRLLDLITFWN